MNNSGFVLVYFHLMSIPKHLITASDLICI